MSSHTRILVAVAMVLVLCVPALAQQVAYKWVDREGNVHFSDEPPLPSEAVTVEEVILPDSPTPPPTSPKPASKQSQAPEPERERSVAPSVAPRLSEPS